MQGARRTQSAEHGKLDTILPVLALMAFWLMLLPPLVQRGMMTCSHDGAMHLLRAFQLDTLVRQGVLWPRWAPGMVYGYGYPIFNYYPALALYPAVLLHHLGLTLLQGWNLSLALSMLASGLTMFLWTRQVLGAHGGFVAAVAYMLAPYQLYDVYWRGNVTESLTLPMLPIVMWAALRMTQERRWRYALIGAMAYAAVLLMHAPASLMLTLVLSAYALMLLWSARDRHTVAFQLAGMTLLALGLAAFFLAPAFLERGQVQYERAIMPGGQNFHNHFLSLGELFGPAPASDPLLVNPSPPRSLGWAVGLLALIGVLATLWMRARLSQAHRRHVIWASLTLPGVVAVMLPVSEPIWSRVPLLPFIQFPWRFLGVGSVLAGWLAGAGIAALGGEAWRASRLSRGTARGMALVLCLALLEVGVLPWAYPRLCSASDEPTQAAYTDYEISTGLIGTTSSTEYLPVAVQDIPTTSPMVDPLRTGRPVVRWDAPGAHVVETRDDGLSAELVLDTDSWLQVTYQAFYFPGWQAQLDGQTAFLKVVPPLGVMAIDVPAGRHTVAIRFGSTLLRTTSQVISLLTVVVMLAVGILDLRSPFAVSQPTRYTPRLKWMGLVALGLLLFALKIGVVDRYDTPLRWRRLQLGQFSDATHTVSDVVIDGRARLLGYDVRPQPVASGDVVYVDLYWTLTQSFKFRAAVRLLDERGLEWSDKNELDIEANRGGYSPPPPSREWPVGAYANDRHAIRILPGTPPGSYSLVVVPFHPETLEPRPITSGQPAPGDYPGVVIGKLEVSRPAGPPSVDSLDLAVRVESSLGNDLTLVGYSQDREEAAPGQVMLLALGWQSRRQPHSDYAARLELVAPDGQVVTQLPLSPGGDHYPTTRWQVGQVVRAQVLAHIPGRAQSGLHYWRITLLDGDGTQVGQATLGKLQITAPQHIFAASAMSNRLNVQLGDWVSLAGFDAPVSINAGQRISVTLLWQALSETFQDYKVFVHLLSAEGRVVAQSDAVPVGWTRPTSGWLAGEFVTDIHTLEIKRDVPPGDYNLLIGMYDSVDGKRLLAADGGDAVSLGTIQIFP